VFTLRAVDGQAFASLGRVLEEQGGPPPHLEGGYHRPAVVRTIVADALLHISPESPGVMNLLGSGRNYQLFCRSFQKIIAAKLIVTT
jgi:hypothetical protein